jgi:hypothetical protein
MKITKHSFLLLVLAAAPAASAAVLLSEGSDATYRLPKSGSTLDGGGTLVDTTQGLQVGPTNANQDMAAGITVFQLPSLGSVVNPFTTASFTIYSSSSFTGTGTGLAADIDLYGLGRRASSAVLASDFFQGPTGGDTTDATLLQGSLLSAGALGGGNLAFSTNSTGSTALLNYLNAAYANGAGAGQYVFLRLNMDSNGTTSNRANFSSANTGGTSYVPQITYTIPEPGSLMLSAGAAVLLAGRRTRRQDV